MAKFSASTNSTLARRARMQRESPAVSKLSRCCADRHVRVERIIYIGKESNRLEEIEAGVIHSPESVYTEYPDPSRDEWQTKILPLLKRVPVGPE